MKSSKRKFQTLLNGLGTKSTSSLNGDVNNSAQTALLGRKEHDLQSKRPRTGNPSMKRIPSPTQSTGVMSNRKYPPLASQSSTEQPPSDSIKDQERQYNPYDREAFLARLRTYSKLLDWSAKPARVDANEWAKRGWVCKKDERVRCVYCFVEIMVKVNMEDVDGIEQRVYVTSNIADALVDKYADMIVTAHAEACPWRQRGCGETIFHLTLNNTPITLQALRDRYDTLCALSDRLPYMHNMYVREGYNLDETLTYLPRDFFKHSEDPLIDTASINRVAIYMALCGWHGLPATKPSDAKASCSSCFRNLGLWLFKSQTVDEQGECVVGANMEHLDPIVEHRDYCPWRSGQAQSGPGKKADEPLLAAWEVIIRVLKNNHYLSTASNEALSENSTTTAASRPTTGYADDEQARDEKDKQRRSRLSRIKSLFDVKGGTKLQKNSLIESKESPV